MKIKKLKTEPEKGKYYKVGGHVRDIILNVKSNDCDYVITGSSIEEELKKGHTLIEANNFPVFLNKDGDEIALARTERKTSRGYQGFEIETKDITLKEDLSRRDLTINSIALIKESKEELIIFDPFDGYRDLENKILRHTTEAFKEDPVRVLRLARFATRFPEFKIAEETKELVMGMREELKNLTPERIFKEVEKMLSHDKPSIFFKTLLEMDVLDILFPELYDMVNCEHNKKYHAEGSPFIHTMLVLDEAAKQTKDKIIRYAALYHDIGKPEAYRRTGKSSGHDGEELVISLFESLAERQRMSNKYKIFATKCAILHQKFYTLDQMSEKKIAKLFVSKYFPKTKKELKNMLIMLNADMNGRIKCENEDHPNLTEDEIELIMNSEKEVKIDGYVYIKGNLVHFEKINEEFIYKVFEGIKEISPKEYIIEFEKKHDRKPSGEAIKEFMHKERIRVIKNIRKNLNY